MHNKGNSRYSNISCHTVFPQMKYLQETQRARCQSVQMMKIDLQCKNKIEAMNILPVALTYKRNLNFYRSVLCDQLNLSGLKREEMKTKHVLCLFLNKQRKRLPSIMISIHFRGSVLMCGAQKGVGSIFLPSFE